MSWPSFPSLFLRASVFSSLRMAMFWSFWVKSISELSGMNSSVVPLVIGRRLLCLPPLDNYSEKICFGANELLIEPETTPGILWPLMAAMLALLIRPFSMPPTVPILLWWPSTPRFVFNSLLISIFSTAPCVSGLYGPKFFWKLMCDWIDFLFDFECSNEFIDGPWASSGLYPDLCCIAFI